jgi:hypothetical protein
VSIIYFTLVAILLYLFSDWLVLRIEALAGRRLEYRSIIFFAILLSLAMASFSMIQFYTGNP